MIVDIFNVDSYCSEHRCTNHRLLNDTGRTAGREREVARGENGERHFRMLAQSRQRAAEMQPGLVYPGAAQLACAGPGSGALGQARAASALSTGSATRRQSAR